MRGIGGYAHVSGEKTKEHEKELMWVMGRLDVALYYWTFKSSDLWSKASSLMRKMFYVNTRSTLFWDFKVDKENGLRMSVYGCQDCRTVGQSMTEIHILNKLEFRRALSYVTVHIHQKMVFDIQCWVLYALQRPRFRFWRPTSISQDTDALRKDQDRRYWKHLFAKDTRIRNTNWR